MMTNPPIDNLVRLNTQPIELRSEGDSDGNTMFGHFAVFDRWTEIDSWYEGRFLERIARGAFRQTFKERAGQIRVLYDHGYDPTVGNKPLGAPEVLREDSDGAYYEVPLFDAAYVNELKPAIRAGQMGASFRFRVTAEKWVEPKKASDSNPQQLKERTITAVDLFEFGPVTFPAYADASAGLRSTTDQFLDRLINDPTFVARFTERAGLRVVEQILASAADGPGRPPVTAPDGPPPEPGRSVASSHITLLTYRRAS